VIAKVTKGSSFGGLARYLYGPGRHEEHVDAHMVGGNLAVEDRPRVIAEELRDIARDNPRVRRPVFHASLSLPEGERLSDEQWHRAGEMFVDRMGFHEGQSEAPWAIVRHDGDEGRHVHIVASRVRFDGSTVSDSYDFKRSHEACRAVEADHGLSSPQPSPERLASVSRSEREAASRRGVAPERGQLRQALQEARDSGDGTREDFEQRAGRRGVLLRANQSPSTGRMNGYSASLEGWTDARGEQVWMPASKVHKSLRWQQLESDIADRRSQQRGAQPPPAARTPDVQQEEDAPMPRLEDELAAAARKNRELEEQQKPEPGEQRAAEQQPEPDPHHLSSERDDDGRELAPSFWSTQMNPPDRDPVQRDLLAQARQDLDERFPPATEPEHAGEQQESQHVEEQEPEPDEQRAAEQQEREPDEQQPAEQEPELSNDPEPEPGPRESEAAQTMRESQEREREQEHER